MNKVFTIGRDGSCDIVIQDSTDVVSRVHALLRVCGRDKYILIDQSRNGTYVNGIRMSANEEIPVSRKDVISFAHVKDLDWNQIPKGKNAKPIWIASILIVVVAACACLFIFRPEEEPIQPIADEPEVPVEKYEAPAKNDTAARETIYVKPKAKPVARQKPKKEAPAEKTDENREPEEPEIVNPLL